MRIATASTRPLWAIVLGLALALRLIGSTGYMPGLDHGRLTIVVCPDADLNAPLALGSAHHHHHGPGKHAHAPCPYASASSLGALVVEFPALLAGLIFAAALLLGRESILFARQRRRERPPPIGPPLPA
jgi:hypothetical protein